MQALKYMNKLNPITGKEARYTKKATGAAHLLVESTKDEDLDINYKQALTVSQKKYI